jgi:uncharacterized protein YdiU (UPF0061 family)
MKWDNSYSRLPDIFTKPYQSAQFPHPQIILWNRELADRLGLVATEEEKTTLWAQFLSGNQKHPDSQPVAMAYAGHQFGHFTMLGDGRAVLLGEVISPDEQRYDIHLKGAGQTEFSRRGDGRAALGPMVREYIVSEAMYYLGVPTSRSLAVVKTGETIMRDGEKTGAVLTRVAQSHIRLGTFEYLAMLGDIDNLRKFLDYTIARHDSDIIGEPNRAYLFLSRVADRQIKLITEWMRVGFIHGVMNTDNVAISGETIDYGPCAFMDVYNPHQVFSSIDHNGRYAFSNQPIMAQWNLARLAEAILPLLHDNQDKAIQMAEDCIEQFASRFRDSWFCMMAKKIGIQHSQPSDYKTIQNLLDMMAKYQADYTLTFYDLRERQFNHSKFWNEPVAKDWYQSWVQRMGKDIDSAKTVMKEANPAIIPRNHSVEQCLRDVQDNNNFDFLNSFLEALKTPYAMPDDKNLTRPPETSERVYQTFCGT